MPVSGLGSVAVATGGFGRPWLTAGSMGNPRNRAEWLDARNSGKSSTPPGMVSLATITVSAVAALPAGNDWAVSTAPAPVPSVRTRTTWQIFIHPPYPGERNHDRSCVSPQYQAAFLEQHRKHRSGV